MNRFPPVSEEFKVRLKQYCMDHGGYGSLHMVLSGRNVEDSQVLWTVGHCIHRGDHEARWLSKQLLTMSRTQRLKMAYLK